MKHLSKWLICLLASSLLLTSCLDEGILYCPTGSEEDPGSTSDRLPGESPYVPIANGGSIYLADSVYEKSEEGQDKTRSFVIFAKVDKGILMNTLYNGMTVAEWEQLLESLKENPYREEYKNAMEIYSGMLDEILLTQTVPASVIAQYSDVLRLIIGDDVTDYFVDNGATLDKVFAELKNLSTDKMEPSSPCYGLVRELELIRDRAVASHVFPDYDNMTYDEFYNRVVMPAYQRMQQWDSSEEQMKKEAEDNYYAALQTLSEEDLIAALGEQGILARPTTMDITSFSYSSYVDDCDPAYYQKNPGSYYRNTGGTVTCLIQTDLPTLEALVPISGVHATVYGGQITEENGLTFVYGLWDYAEYRLLEARSSSTKVYATCDWSEIEKLGLTVITYFPGQTPGYCIELTPDGRAVFHANDESMIKIGGRYDDWGVTLDDGTRIPFTTDRCLIYDGNCYELDPSFYTYQNSALYDSILTANLEKVPIPVLKYCPVADTEALLNDFREMLENGYPVVDLNLILSRLQWITFELELSEGVTVTKSSLVQYSFPGVGATPENTAVLEHDMDLSANNGRYTITCDHVYPLLDGFDFSDYYYGYCLYLELSDGTSYNGLFILDPLGRGSATEIGCVDEIQIPH